MAGKKRNKKVDKPAEKKNDVETHVVHKKDMDKIKAVVPTSLQHLPKLNLKWHYLPLLLVIMLLALDLRVYNAEHRLTAYDPFFQTRMAYHIDEHGSMPEKDRMAYYPIGRPMEFIRHMAPYAIVGVDKALSLIDSDYTVEEAAKVYPAVVGVIAILTFFFFAVELFDIPVALIATMVLGTIQGFLYRTSSGFADKEAVGIMFLSFIFYFFAKALNAKEAKKYVFFSILSGVCIHLMAMSWGGFQVSIYAFAAFLALMTLFGKLQKRHVVIVATIVLLFFLLDHNMYPRPEYRQADYALFFWGCFLLSLVYMAVVEKKIFYTPWLQVSAAVAITAILGLLALFVMTGGNPNAKLTVVYNSIMGIRPEVGDVHRFSVGEQQRPTWVWPGAKKTGPMIDGGLTPGWKSQQAGNTWWNRAGPAFGFSIFGLIVCLWFGLNFGNENALFASALMIMTLFVSFIMVRLHFPLAVPVALLTGFIFKFLWDAVDLKIDDKKPDPRKVMEKNWLMVGLFVIPFIMGLIMAVGGSERGMSPEYSDFANAVQLFFQRESIGEYLTSKPTSEDAMGWIKMLFPLVWFVSYAVLIYSYLGEKKDKMRVYTKKFIIGAALFFVLMFLYSSSYIFSRSLSSSLDDDWLDALLYLRHKTEENSIVFTWWDYGYWLEYVSNKDTVADGENKYGEYNVDMGQMFMKTNAKDFFEFTKFRTLEERGSGKPFMKFHTDNYQRPAYIIMDNTLIGKFYWVSHIGDNCLKYGCGTQFHFLRYVAQNQDEKGRTVLSYNGYLDSGISQYGGANSLLNLRIDTSEGGLKIVPELFMDRNGNGQLELDERQGMYLIKKIAGFPDLSVAENSRVFPGMLLVAGDLSNPRGSQLIYIQEKAIDMLFTRMFFFEGQGVEDFVEKVYDSPRRTVKIYKVKYPQTSA